MRITVLGTGSADSQPARTSTSLLVEHEDVRYLLDCGPTVPHQLVRAGRRPEELDAVFLSHAHGDHLLGLPILLHDMKVAGRREALTVVAPAPAVPTIRSLADFAFPGFWEKVPFEVRLRGMEGERAAPRAPGAPRAALTVHGVPCYAVRLGSLCYSGDTAPCERVDALAKGCALLVHEASAGRAHEEAANRYGHSSSRQAAESARRAGAGRLILVHLGPRTPATALEAEARKVFPGKVSAGRERMRITL